MKNIKIRVLYTHYLHIKNVSEMLQFVYSDCHKAVIHTFKGTPILSLL